MQAAVSRWSLTASQIKKRVKMAPASQKDVVLDFTGRLSDDPHRRKVLGAGARSRMILWMLREKGRMTRHQLHTVLPRDLLPSKSKTKSIIDTLVRQRRIQAFLPTGWIKGKDTYAYKLRPKAAAKNFPELYGKYGRARELAQLIYGDVEPYIPYFVKNNPEHPPTRVVGDKAKQAAGAARDAARNTFCASIEAARAPPVPLKPKSKNTTTTSTTTTSTEQMIEQ